MPGGHRHQPPALIFRLTSTASTGRVPMSEALVQTRAAAGAASRPPLGRSALQALAVGASYYLGAQVGLALRFPPATTSVIWPPNALLTAALLLTTPSRWWICIAA